MACSTVSLLWSLPTLRFLSSEKPTPTCYGLPPHNHFVKHFSYATNLNRNSKFRTPQAVLDTSPITPTPLTTSTLRELCQAHVPQHILQRQFQDLSPFFSFLFFLLCSVLRIWRMLFRMEEIGYVMPTDIQREALPYLFSGRDCILHAQVIYILHLLLHSDRCSCVGLFSFLL